MEPIKLLLINNVPMIVVRSGFTVIKYIPHFVHYENFWDSRTAHVGKKLPTLFDLFVSIRAIARTPINPGIRAKAMRYSLRLFRFVVAYSFETISFIARTKSRTPHTNPARRHMTRAAALSGVWYKIAWRGAMQGRNRSMDYQLPRGEDIY